jgi:hypothetical protein
VAGARRHAGEREQLWKVTIMTAQVLVIAGVLVAVALAAVAAALFSPGLRAARRARALADAEEADRLRNDPHGQSDLSVYRWQTRGADTARNPPGSGLPLM